MSSLEGIEEEPSSLLTVSSLSNSEGPSAVSSGSLIAETNNSVENTLADGTILLPFTGERVVPGLVEAQLWNEHISRYRYAALFAKSKRVLDVGCGAGYGTDLLGAEAENAIGFDNSLESVRYASSQFVKATFLVGSADSFPVPGNAFELVTAFEVIEHIPEWERMLQEVARVLRPEGVFLVSTPNKTYYGEARQEVGPNPFHVHEFEYEEFEAALGRHFPYISILAQNQQEAIVFAGEGNAPQTQAYMPNVPKMGESHFFLAVCSKRPIQAPYFTHVSSTSNMLREREIYIYALKDEVQDLRKHHTALVEAHQHLLAVLKDQKLWDSRPDPEVREDNARLRVELESAQRQTEALLRERELIKNSFWLRFGRAIGLGPWSNTRAHVRALTVASKTRTAKAWRAIKSPVVAICGTAVRLAVSVFSAALLIISAMALAAVDLCFAVFGRRRLGPDVAPRHHAASIIIPNWNGRDLLEKYIPSVIAEAAGSDEHEVIVVDNASSDGSSAYLRTHFPRVRVLELARNEGFAGAANAGAKAATNDVIVLLNNDMRVKPGFLPALLAKFDDPLVFAASSQIFFSDPHRVRQETGLTEVWWDGGYLGVGHRTDPTITVAYPCAYPGGGSSAFDRAKFLELGGFDELFHPFYYEDTDLGRLAWKRGWKVLYDPTSVVYHEHRGTIGKTFSASFIDGIVRRNAILYCWKNIHDWRMLTQHFWSCVVQTFSAISEKKQLRRFQPADSHHAFRRLGKAMRSRWKAHSHRRFSDQEAFQRPMAGYYRDRFLSPNAVAHEKLNVLFVSPYPIEPPVHGGAVFMREAVTGLARLTNLHLISFVDTKEQLPAQEPLRHLCKSAQFIVRPHVSLVDQWTLLPNGVREFWVRDFAWAIQRTLYLENIDVLQLEYTMLGQYAGNFRHIPCMLFEHDISSQSLWRRIRSGNWNWEVLLEYVRMHLYEPRLLKRVTRVQVCSTENAKDIRELVPELDGRVDHDLRAGLDVSRYHYQAGKREPNTLLFIGSFRHAPNLQGLHWFTERVFPIILRAKPDTQLMVVGSDPPTALTIWGDHPNIRLLGSVPDVKVTLQQYAVFICPVLSGSGVRVKLLEAFASGIPAVSTYVGAEGLASKTGEVCELADTPEAFADSVLRLLDNSCYRSEIAERARKMMEQKWDSRRATERLEAMYRTEVGRMRNRAAGFSGHRSRSTPDLDYDPVR